MDVLLNVFILNYLTPAKSAGFAPRFDDIEAFISQTEGRKHCEIYAPESFPLESSDNLKDSDFADRTTIFDGWLDQSLGASRIYSSGLFHTPKYFLKNQSCVIY
uniref:JmjC domain-containing protein n=1 Tax=Meloidogyne hapla TaxID=6305 RepID=A0A1I8BMV1_MELHA